MVYTVDGVQYTRRKKIPVTGAASGAQNDYQIKLTALWEDAMQADYDDARFTQSDMQTLIDAWLESKTDSTTADIWVEFPTTPANTVEKTYYMYYGNAGAASAWDGDATFLQYHGSTTTAYLEPLVVPYTNIVHETKIKSTNAVHNLYIGLSNQANMTGGDNLRLHSYTPSNLRYVAAMNNGTQTYKSETPVLPLDTYVKGMLTMDTTTLYGYIDSNEINTGGVTTNLPDTNLGLCVYINYGTYEQEWSFARKYAANPPTATFGTEEHQRRTPMMM